MQDKPNINSSAVLSNKDSKFTKKHPIEKDIKMNPTILALNFVLETREELNIIGITRCFIH